MDIPLILAIASLVAMLANLAHWVVTRRGPFWSLPSGRVWFACIAVIASTSVCVLLGWVPPSAMPLIAMPPFFFQQVGSIWTRNASRAAAA